MSIGCAGVAVAVAGAVEAGVATGADDAGVVTLAATGACLGGRGGAWTAVVGEAAAGAEADSEDGTAAVVVGVGFGLAIVRGFS